MDISVIISRNLKNELSRRNLNVNNLSKISGVSQPTIWRYVNGEGNPQIDRLKKVADALDVEVSDLLR